MTEGSQDLVQGEVSFAKTKRDGGEMSMFVFKGSWAQAKQNSHDARSGGDIIIIF